MKRVLAKIPVFFREVTILPIRFYRRFLSPLKAPSCRYVPTCSAYAMLAIRHYGIFLGLIMALCRILRCHPFSKGGYDPVPSHFSLRPYAGVQDPLDETIQNPED